jgi:FixJ family two-component response regulator
MQKPFNEQLLLDRVQKAIAQCRERLAAERRQQAFDSRLAGLTPRERDVVDAILSGLPNKRIATQLNISIKTVEQHRGNAMHKLGARSLADLFILLGTPKKSD